MSFNFPNAPATGATYTPSGGPTYTWDGVAWKAVTQGVPVTVYVSDTAPVSPAPGQLWWNSTTGNMAIWYSDPDSAQWVQVSGSVSAVQTAQARNRLVNPCFQIQQDSTASGGYPCDQWVFANNVPGAVAIWTEDGASPNGSLKAIALNAATPRPSLSAGDLYGLGQRLEGTRLADCRWGQPDAQQFVLRFTLWTDTAGTYSIALVTADNSRSYVDTFTVTPAMQPNYNTFTFAIPGPTTGPMIIGGTSQVLTLNIMFAVGSTGQTATKGWQSGQKFGHSSMSNGAAASTINFYIYDVGFYKDPLKTGTPPPWQMPDEAQELAACQRYFYNGCPPLRGIAPGGANQVGRLACRHPVVMRITPAVAYVSSLPIFDGVTVGVVSGIASNYSTASVVEIDGTSPTTYTARVPLAVYQGGGAGSINISARM